MTQVATGARAEVVLDLGAGPPVVLLHGVGLGPRSFDQVATRLAARHRAIVLRRPDAADRSVERAAQDVLDAVRSVDAAGTATLVGVSGGATLALAAAMAEPSMLARVVAHEPLLGPLAPALDRRVQEGAARLVRGADDEDGWLRGLVGEHTWAAVVASDDRTAVSTAEVRAFAAWTPAADQLEALRAVALVTTVGAGSGAHRHEAAAALARLSGARVVVLADAGHLPQVEQPDLFAAAIEAAT